MNINYAVNQTKNNKNFLLSDFYKQDKWDLKKHPFFRNLTQHQQFIMKDAKRYLDFSICQNSLIKNEIKYFCQNLLEVRKFKLSYFASSVASRIVNLINFTNEYYSDMESILDKKFDEANEEYSQFLMNKGINLFVTTKNTISSDMEIKEYQQSSPNFRIFKNLYSFLKNEFKSNKDDTKNFFDKDKWDIRELPFKVQGFDPSRPRYTISFEKIIQDKIKTMAKKYTIERLKTKKYTTCIDDLKGINILSEFLSNEHPEINSLTQLNREVIEEFLGHVNLNSNLKPRTQSSRLGAVKTFFETCTLFGWDEAPKQTLLLTDDVKKKYKVLPKFYEDNVILQINKNLEQLPVQIARMVFVLQNVGMRISELCNLKVDCIKMDTEKDPILIYMQEKTDEINRVPIKKDVAMAIEEAKKLSKEKFGKNVRYVFMQNENRPISKDTFSYHMNQLIKKNDIRDSSGNLVRIKSHHFRGTVATKYANLGMSPNIIRTLLGQKSLGAIRHYVEILEETITDGMQNLLNYQDQMIQNIGNKEAVIQITDEDKVEIPLPNGRCAKPLSAGKCTHANACYTCAMFKPDPKNIDLFKYQLSEAKSNVEMAKINGFERVLQVNEDLVAALEKIIASIEKRGA